MLGWGDGRQLAHWIVKWRRRRRRKLSVQQTENNNTSDDDQGKRRHKPASVAISF
jgi:hypothetical protein